VGHAAWAVPSKYIRQKAVTAAEKVSADAEPLLARHRKAQADNKLDTALDGGITIAHDIASRLRNVWYDGLDAFDEAIADGWTVEDADIAKARDLLAAAYKQLEPAGLWTSVRVGDKPIERFRNRLDMIRDEAYLASVELRLKKVDDATERLEDVDRRLAGLKRELENAENAGETLPMGADHPAYKRTLEEVQRLRNQGASVIADTTKMREGVDQDVETLISAREKADELFRMADDIATTSGDDEQRQAAYDKALAAFAEFDAKTGPALQKLLDEFGAKYGTSQTDIENKLHELKGGPVDYRRTPGAVYEEIAAGIAAVAKARQDVAIRLLEQADQALDNLGDYDERIRLETIDKQKPVLELALKFDPNNADAKERLTKLPDLRKAEAEKIERAIDARKWPANKTDFAGPGKVADLVAASMAWIKANGQGDDKVVLAVRVVDDWFVNERDVLGQPKNYGLPVLVAYQMHKDKAAGKDLAVVFELNMITRDAKMAPPFVLTGVMGSYWFRASKIPKTP
jgi:hypothetical protein